MKSVHRTLFFSMAALVTLSASSVALATSSQSTDDQNSALPVYEPPLLGKPSEVIAGASRNAEQGSTTLRLLAPNGHTGRTLEAQPSLYWHLSHAETVDLVFTVVDPNAIDPLIELEMNEFGQSGIVGVSLKEHDVSLKPDVEYKWYVSVVVDSDQPSADLVAGATIVRVEPNASLAQELSAATSAKQAYLYAENGYWYDAIAALSGQIESQPSDRLARERRAALTAAAGLPEVAAFDRSP